MTDTVPSSTIVPAGYDPAAPDANRHVYAQAMLDEAKTLFDGVERFVVLVTAIHDQKLYLLLGHKTFDAMVLAEWGRSRSTGARWVTQGKALLELDQPAPAEANGSGLPAQPAGPAISQREAARRHQPTDTPPVTLEPEMPTTLEDPLPGESVPLPGPGEDTAGPVGHDEMADQEWAESARTPAKPITRLPGAGRPAPAESQARLQFRQALNRIMVEVYRHPPEDLAKVATAAERSAITALAEAMAPKAKADPIPTTATPANLDEALAALTTDEPAEECLHPENRRLGNRCGACGKTVKKGQG